jgi:hypothetical protein
MEFLKRNWSYVLLGIAVVAFMLVFMLTHFVGNLIWHAFYIGLFGALVYAADYHTIQELGTKRMQFGIALLIATVWAIISPDSAFKSLLLWPWDVLVLMCTFALSAKAWPNRAIIEKRFKEDPLAAMREGFSGAGGAIREGSSTAWNEAGRTVNSFRSTTPPTTPPAA